MFDFDFQSLFETMLDLFTAGAILGLFYLFVSLLTLLRVRRSEPTPRPRRAPITILKPLHGHEPGLLGRLLATHDQDYEAPIQIILGCHDREDAAIPVVDRLKRARPDADIDLVVDPRIYGANRKVSNLVNMFESAKHQVLIASDSDIEVEPSYLARVVDALETDGVGAVTCLYHGVPGEGAPAELSALAINAHFLPNVILATKLGLVRPCFGSTIATTRPVIERIGGLRAFADKFADDYEIGSAVRAAGFEIAIPDFTVGHACNERTLAEFLSQHVRNARTIKSIDPFGHAGSFICNPLPMALIGMMEGTGAAAAIAGAALALRLAVCKLTQVKLGLPKQKLHLLPLADILLFGVFIASFFGSSVSWRGRRYRVIADGRLSHDPS